MSERLVVFHSQGAAEKLEGFCQMLEGALAIAHMDLDQLILARELMSRVTAETRSNSKLPGLAELFLSRPQVTVPLGAKLLKITPKAVDLRLAHLGGALPRELTGRTRYRGWVSSEAAQLNQRTRMPVSCEFIWGKRICTRLTGVDGQSMIKTLIIADDLTGAADCAVSWATAGSDTVVLFNANAAPGNATAVSVDVNSRAMTAQEAGAAVTGTVRQLYSKSTRILYHKIDSTLRGNWPSELAHIRQVATDVLEYAPLVIVAPAFPGTGRATIDGHVFVNGTPLENTSLWKQAGLARSADLRTILADVGFKVGVTTLEQVALGSEALKARLAKWADAGCGAVVCDAQTEDDLLTVAAASRMLPGKPLWVGSAGLMRALVTAGEGEVVPSSAPTWAAAGRPILVVVGTASSVSHTQFNVLAEERGLLSLTIRPSVLRDNNAPERVQSYSQALDRALASGSDVAVAIRGEAINFQEGPRLAAALAEFVAPLLSRVGGLIVTGGETARAILDRAGISGLRMQGEIEPGAPVGLSVGDFAIPVITKAGAFGDPTTLKRCLAILRGDRSNYSN